MVALLFCALLSLYLLIVLWSYAEPRIGRRFPEWAWLHGSPDMQWSAAQVLVTRIKPGMTSQEVIGMLGPGAADWPRLKGLQLAPEQKVGFNVRAEGNYGIDVGFRDGLVVSVSIYQ